MFRRLLAYLFPRRFPRADASGGAFVEGSPGRIPARRACDAETDGGATGPTGLEGAPTEQLKKICEDYWAYLAQPKHVTTDDPAGVAQAMGDEVVSREATERYRVYVSAVNELGCRGAEIRDWARLQLGHPDYEAREMAAWWIGQLGARGKLEGAVEDVISELRTLVNRPVEEDPKERQAIDAAITAIGKIGHPSGVAALRDVLFSTKWYHEDDTQYEAAEALGKLVGSPFMDQADPVQAAREWLRDHAAPGKE